MRAPLKRGEKEYIIVPNEFFNGWMREVNENEWMILCFIFRKTVGWSKSEDWINYEQFLDALPLCRQTLANNLKSLVKKEMIFCREEKYRGTLKKIHYRLNVESRACDELKKCHREGFDESKNHTRDEYENHTQQNNNSLTKEQTTSNDDKECHRSPLNSLQEYFLEKLKTVVDNPAFNWAVAGKWLKGLLKTQTELEIKSTMDMFFKSKDKFIISRGFRVEDFVQNYNAYKSGVTEKVFTNGKGAGQPRSEPGKYDGLEE